MLNRVNPKKTRAKPRKTVRNRSELENNRPKSTRIGPNWTKPLPNRSNSGQPVAQPFKTVQSMRATLQNRVNL